ncbi:hypothetical protein PHMEG_00020931 [Phytophthora megakarya]|uniref:Uncharacterized protein n=1 Tax=Phytophthora megakarya TaxID=4795 RepID=A0A225VMY1_9STRA|nr:hypothetical protein PHMEG_00020931 [Phytophthora megakarya]
MWQRSLSDGTCEQTIAAEFQQFKEEAKLIVNTMDDPSEHRLQKAMPVLQSKLDGVHKDLKLSVDKISSTLQAVEANVAGVMPPSIPLTNGSALLQVRLVPQGTASTTTTTINKMRGLLAVNVEAELRSSTK